MMVIKSYNELGRHPEPGDRVKIKDRPGHYCWSTRMDKYLSSIMTVREFLRFENCCKMEEDVRDYLGNSKPGWNWYMDAIEGVVIEEYEDIIEDTSVWAADTSLDILLT